MDPKHVAIAHGEKAVVGLVALISAWTVYDSFTDPGIRPDNKGGAVTQQTIQKQIDDINARMGSSSVPSLVQPKAYMQLMSDRFAVDLPRPQRMSWLFAHPDIDGSVSSGPYFYLYEMYQPTVSAQDEIGKVVLKLGAPDGQIHPDVDAADPSSGERSTISDRHSADWDWVKPRPTERGDVVNQAHLLGVMVETAIGQDGWHPLDIATKVSNGFIPIDKITRTGTSLKFASEATWQEVRFRVRSIYKATGFTGADPHADETILMHLGFRAEPKDWKLLDDQFKEDPATLLKDFVQPDDSAPPAGVTLAKGEHLYYTDWNEPPEARTIVTADVRFAFLKYDASANSAVFEVSRQFAGGKWLAKPERFPLKIGQQLGGKVEGISPLDPNKLLQTIDLSTPFRLVDLKPDEQRTLFWKVRMVTDPNAAPGARARKKLELDPVIKKVNVAILQNTNTGDKTEYASLEIILRPDANPEPVFYPITPKHAVNEMEEFDLNPAGYVQLPMEAAKPQEFQPNDPNGPLAALHNNPNGLYAGQATTDVPYYQMPDGRLVWINEENIKHGIFQSPEPRIPDEPMAKKTTTTGTPAQPHGNPPPRPAPPHPSNGGGHGPPPPTGDPNFHGPPPGVAPPGVGNPGGAGVGGAPSGPPAGIPYGH